MQYRFRDPDAWGRGSESTDGLHDVSLAVSEAHVRGVVDAFGRPADQFTYTSLDEFRARVARHGLKVDGRQLSIDYAAVVLDARPEVAPLGRAIVEQAAARGMDAHKR